MGDTQFLSWAMTSAVINSKRVVPTGKSVMWNCLASKENKQNKISNINTFRRKSPNLTLDI